jgi:hypothetical protein
LRAARASAYLFVRSGLYRARPGATRKSAVEELALSITNLGRAVFYRLADLDVPGDEDVFFALGSAA